MVWAVLAFQISSLSCESAPLEKNQEIHSELLKMHINLGSHLCTGYSPIVFWRLFSPTASCTLPGPSQLQQQSTHTTWWFLSSLRFCWWITTWVTGLGPPLLSCTSYGTLDKGVQWCMWWAAIGVLTLPPQLTWGSTSPTPRLLTNHGYWGFFNLRRHLVSLARFVLSQLKLPDPALFHLQM